MHQVSTPQQQEGQDHEKDVAAVPRTIEEAKMMIIEKLLEVSERLLGMIPKLLQKHADRRRVSADDARKLWGLEFIQFELRGFVASLSQLQLSEFEIGDVVWFDTMYRAMSTLVRYLDNRNTTLPPWKAQLRKTVNAAAPCLNASVFDVPARFVLHLEEAVSWAAFRPYMYKHLLLGDDGDRTIGTSSSAVQPHHYAVGAEADAGGNIPLVGIERALRNKLLRWFMDDREDHKVISFFGPAGVGKTTRAMEVYRQLQTRGGRSCCAMAKVSRRPDIKKLLLYILSQIDKSKALEQESSIQRSQISNLQDEQDYLASTIYQYLQDKRYLILIDDIWKESDWEIIKTAFPPNSRGSRIIITTCIRSVALSFGRIHEVKPLNELDSKSLLLIKAFGSENGYPPDHLKLSCDEIMRRCEGMPLFISGMADWLKEQYKGQQEFLRPDTNYGQLLKQFELSLSPTYDDLPYKLKVLILYMSMFPHGFMFEKDSLIRKWMCVGLYTWEENKEWRYTDMLRKGEKYFTELVDRNVITRVANCKQTPQVEEECHWQVSYFMLQFLASKSADQGFVFTSDTLTSVAAGGKKLWHLSLHQPCPEPLIHHDLSHTRSLAISGTVDGIPLDKFIYLISLDLEGWQCFKEEDMSVICKIFLLRYLSVRNTGVSKIPPEIKELRHLQTLDLSHTQITELPSEICRLEKLMTLDIRSTPIRHLPEDIGYMFYLNNLFLGGDVVNHDETVTQLPMSIFRSRRLIRITTVDLSECSASFIEEALLSPFPKEVLAITWSFHQCTDTRFQKALCSFLERSLLCFQSLTIQCELGCSMEFLDSLSDVSLPDEKISGDIKKFKVTGGRFGKIPQWFGRLRNLAIIHITVSRLDQDGLSILGNLPSLECLVLGLHLLPEEAIVIYGVGFRYLQRLSIDCRVPWLTFNQGAMPELTHLELKIAGSPANQESVPSGISILWHLLEVVLNYKEWYSNSPSVKMAAEAVRKGEDEYRNPVELFINGVEDEEIQSVQEDLPRATGGQSEIEIVG